MSIRALYRGPVQRGFATPSSAPIRIDDTNNLPYLNGAGTGTTEKQIALQAAALVVTTKAVTQSENGTKFFLDLAAGFVVTLPAVALGLEYEFILKTAVTGSTTIVCPAAAALFKGHVLSNDLNAASDADFDTTAVATLTFVLNKAVAGDRIKVISDGTNWFYRAECSVFDAITGT